MEIAKFFYPIYVVAAGSRVGLRGNAFPVTPNGGLITCRHVLDIALEGDQTLAVLDLEVGALVNIQEVLYARAGVDLAYIPNGLSRTKAEFFPILTPSIVRIGDSVHTFGHYVLGGGSDAQSGYFAGRIVSVRTEASPTGAIGRIVLPYPVIEGLSGSPVLTYHNGTKLVGVCQGNEAQRILAVEHVEISEQAGSYRETIHRQVEFGVACHGATIVEFLTAVRADGFSVTDGRLDMPELG